MSRVLARATVNLPNLRAGSSALVDDSDARVQSLISAGYLELLREPGFAEVEIMDENAERRREAFGPKDPA